MSFSVSESDYMRAQNKPKDKSDFKNVIRMILSDGSEYKLEGSFDMVDRAVDPRTGTLGIRVEFSNPDGALRPGQYAKIRVLFDEIADAVVVPVRAVLDVQGMKSLFVVGQDGKVVSQPVELGFERNSLVVVKKGVKPGDMVIVDGIQRVRPGMGVKPIIVPMDVNQGQSVNTGGADNGTQPAGTGGDDGKDQPVKTEEKAG